jgi:hypothetical protein
VRKNALQARSHDVHAGDDQDETFAIATTTLDPRLSVRIRVPATQPLIPNLPY